MKQDEAKSISKSIYTKSVAKSVTLKLKGKFCTELFPFDILLLNKKKNA